MNIEDWHPFPMIDLSPYEQLSQYGRMLSLPTVTSDTYYLYTPPQINIMPRNQQEIDEAYCKGYNEGYERCKEINGYSEKGITRGKVVNITFACEVCPACNRLTALATYCSWCGAKRLP